MDSFRIMSAVDSEREWWLDHVYHDMPAELQAQWQRKEDEEAHWAFYNIAMSHATEEMALDYIARSGLLYTCVAPYNLTTHLMAWLENIESIGDYRSMSIAQYWEDLAEQRLLFGDLLRDDPDAVRKGIRSSMSNPYRRSPAVSSQALIELRCRWLDR